MCKLIRTFVGVFKSNLGSYEKNSIIRNGSVVMFWFSCSKQQKEKEKACSETNSSGGNCSSREMFRLFFCSKVTS